MAESLFWQASQLPDAIAELAFRSGLTVNRNNVPMADDFQADDVGLSAIAGHLGCELDSVSMNYGELEDYLPQAAPLVIQIPNQGFLLVIRSVGKKVRLWIPSRQCHDYPVDRLIAGLRTPLEREPRQRLQSLVDGLNLSSGKRRALMASLLRDQMSEQRLRGFWLLRASPGISLYQQLKQCGFFRLCGGFVVLFLLIQGILTGSWLLVGNAVLNGDIDHGRLTGWALLLTTAIVLQGIATWLQNLLGIKLGCLLKRRLLYGILQISPDRLRHQGAGRFMGIAMEASESLEGFAIGGGFNAVIAVFQCFAALLVLLWVSSGLVVLWVIGLLVAILLIRQYLRQTRQWLLAYQSMSTDLIERMMGHRTRLAQQEPAHWHDEEDRQLARYGWHSRSLDQAGVWLQMLARGWLITAGCGLLINAWLSGLTPAFLGINVLGVLLAFQGLTALGSSIPYLRDAMIAWWEVKPLFKAAAENPVPASFLPPAMKTANPLLTVDHLTFHYTSSRPLFKDVTLIFQSHSRWLLEGPSGGGKSTLAAVLSGLQASSQGALILKGVEKTRWSPAAWRKAVVSVPQFHENYVFGETFLFNLLMGCRWPPEQEKIKEAESLCQALGLGPLLERMPAGLQQMVGECGWVLSHGERSRLYMARALLQPADLIILDESFAALDPETLIQVMECVLQRAPALLVIAHP